MRTFFEGLFYNPDLVTDEMVDLYVGMQSQQGAQDAYLATVRALMTPFGPRKDVVADIVDNLGEITAPTLVVWGRDDATVPLAFGETAVAGIPDAELFVLDACGHVPSIEHADLFNARVR